MHSTVDIHCRLLSEVKDIIIILRIIFMIILMIFIIIRKQLGSWLRRSGDEGMG